MAIAESDLQAVVEQSNPSANVALVDGAMNQAFADAQSGSGITYTFVSIRNNNQTLSWSAGKIWLEVDPGGAVVSIASADATVRSTVYAYTLPSPAGLTYSIPTDYAGGLTIATLTPVTKVLFCLKRDTAAAGAVYPELNRIRIRGTSPI